MYTVNNANSFQKDDVLRARISTFGESFCVIQTGVPRGVANAARTEVNAGTHRSAKVERVASTRWQNAPGALPLNICAFGG